MILEAARAAAYRLFTPPFRGVLWKSLGLTILALVALWFGLGAAAESALSAFIFPNMPDLPAWAGWIGIAAAIIAGIGLALGLAILIAPITALIAGVFLDDVAEVVEHEDYPDDPPGRALPALTSIWLAVKFLGIVIAANLVALMLLIVPGINIAAFFLVNGYLLGREYFEFAAMRHRPEAEAKALRSRHSTTIFLAGLVIAGFMAVPLLNLLTPLFAAAMMVHLHKMVARDDPSFSATLRKAEQRAA